MTVSRPKLVEVMEDIEVTPGLVQEMTETAYATAPNNRYNYSGDRVWAHLFDEEISYVETPIGKVYFEASSGRPDYDEIGYSTVDIWLVIRVAFNNGEILFYKKEGQYSSYEGVELDSRLRETRQVEKTIQVWE